MRRSLLPLLRCPTHGSPLEVDASEEARGRVRTGRLTCSGGSCTFQIREFVPRFVESSGYSENFGLQWNRFARTQLDSYSGTTITRDRFVLHSGWSEADLQGKRVLEVGGGAGRFTEVALDMGASVVSLDYSSAVDACRANHANAEELEVVQADLYQMPFAPDTFDLVYCFGVIQHTPDPHGAFRALLGPLKPGGRVAVDIYARRWENLLWPKYWMRPLTKQVEPHRLLSAVERWVPRLLPLSNRLASVPGVGRRLRHVLPVVNYRGLLPLDEKQLSEWAVLDTFDMLSATYDAPQSRETLENWMKEAGLEEIQVSQPGFVTGQARKPG